MLLSVRLQMGKKIRRSVKLCSTKAFASGAGEGEARGLYLMPWSASHIGKKAGSPSHETSPKA